MIKVISSLTCSLLSTNLLSNNIAITYCTNVFLVCKAVSLRACLASLNKEVLFSLTSLNSLYQ